MNPNKTLSGSYVGLKRLLLGIVQYISGGAQEDNGIKRTQTVRMKDFRFFGMNRLNSDLIQQALYGLHPFRNACVPKSCGFGKNQNRLLSLCMYGSYSEQYNQQQH